MKKVEFILARKLIAITANVFFPTTILNIISFSTNYYKNDYFESIVGINLTSMLVLTALIVQVPQRDLSVMMCHFESNIFTQHQCHACHMSLMITSAV